MPKTKNIAKFYFVSDVSLLFYILLDVQTAYNLSTIVSKHVSMAERGQQQLNPNRGLRYNTR
ncbi:hypothetical protein LST1_05430 [Neisseria elongata]|uniref:hypothetical protein n=1 Tax=Neisseria elongata TaxID=495 RepID=UPI002852DD81|nr:hypothetical protein LST1_05430 [Neisseria elongata]